MIFICESLKAYHWCVINIILATNTQHSFEMAAVEEGNSIPARPDTLIKISDISRALRVGQVTHNRSFNTF